MNSASTFTSSLVTSACCQSGCTQRLAAFANTRTLRFCCCMGWSPVHLTWKSLWPQLCPIQVQLNVWKAASLWKVRGNSWAPLSASAADQDKVKAPCMSWSLLGPIKGIKEMTNSVPTWQCHVSVLLHQKTVFEEFCLDGLNFTWISSGNTASPGFLEVGDAQVLKLSFLSPWLCFLVPRGCSSFCLPSSPRLWGEFIESYPSRTEWVRPWMSMAFSAWMRKAEAQGNPETKLADSIESWKLQLHRCLKTDACWPCCKHVLGFSLNTLTRLWVIFVPSKTQCLRERSHKS